MNHLTEDDLVLYYYNEAADASRVQQHLQACELCREEYTNLQRVLNLVDSFPVPERAQNYGEQVWERLGITPRQSWRWRGQMPRWAAIAAVGLLAVAAFIAGRLSPGPPSRAAASREQVHERILLIALGDHLDRSEMVLIELAN